MALARAFWVLAPAGFPIVRLNPVIQRWLAYLAPSPAGIIFAAVFIPLALASSTSAPLWMLQRLALKSKTHSQAVFPRFFLAF
jgi:hypothetical protein